MLLYFALITVFSSYLCPFFHKQTRSICRLQT